MNLQWTQRVGAPLERLLLGRVSPEEEVRRRARALLATLLVFSALLVGWLPIEFAAMAGRGVWVISLLLAGLVSALAVLRWTGHLGAATHLVCASLSLSLLASARFYWGGTGLEMMVALPLVPSMAAAFGGRRLGLTWLLLSLALLAGQTAVSFSSEPPPPLLSPLEKQLVLAITVGLLVLCWGLLVMVYEALHGRTRAQLSEALAQAQAGSRAKDEFMASMSHEIRTPMNGVLGMLGLLLDGKLGNEERDFARAAHHSAEVLLSLLNEVLDFSKLEAGKLELEPLPTDLLAVSEDVVDLMRGRAQQKQLDLALRVAPGLPHLVVTDGGRLRQVLLNLVANAVKFTERGQVLLELDGQADATQVHLVARVEDTGVGIAPEQQEAIFEPFRQADGTTTRRFGGTGLGLTIARRIATAMKGTLTVRSAPGVGSCFELRVTLPRDPHAPEALPPADSLHGARVLIVDDNAINRRIIHEQIVSWGMRNGRFASGAEALDALLEAAAAGDPYQVAIVDCQMPGMSGPEVARAIRADARLSNMALVMLTSVAMPGHEAAMRAHGFDAYVVKPARRSRLMDALLRARLARAGAPPLPPPEAEPEAHPASPQLRVLLADDDVVSLQVARRLLERQRCRVDVASNGNEAVELARRFPYQLIFLDCHMPELDGYGAAQAIRRLEGPNVAVPIVALTADALVGARERALAAGMSDHISKPVKPQLLAAALERWAGPGLAATGS